MKRGLFLYLCLAFIPAAGSAESSKVPVYFDMEPEDKARFGEDQAPEFLTAEDFARLISTATDFLGFSGRDYDRVHITFTELYPEKEGHPSVRVEGRLRVKELNCDMDGLISAERSHDLIRLDYGVDNVHQDAGIERQGMLFSSFLFNTSGSEPCQGTLQGRSKVTWMLMEDGSLRRNDIGNTRFLRGDNQYSGMWKREREKDPVTVNWGEYRIPFARPGLDIGAGEFSANPDYRARGWQDY